MNASHPGPPPPHLPKKINMNAAPIKTLLLLLAKVYYYFAAVGMHTDSKRFPFKGNGFTFRVEIYIKIILSPFLKGVYCKRKEFAQNGLDVNKSKQKVTKGLSLVNKQKKYYQAYQVTLTFVLLNKLRCHAHF